MVAEHSTLRVTAEPFIPQKTVGGATPLKNTTKGGPEFVTPSKQYRLREMSPEEIASKSIRPSPVRQKHTFSPIALFDSPLPNPNNPNQVRVGRNSCSKLHCKRCAYREQQLAKGGATRRELEFQKEHDENCSFASDMPETPLKAPEPIVTTVSGPLPELPRPPQRRKVATAPAAVPTSLPSISSPPSERVTSTPATRTSPPNPTVTAPPIEVVEMPRVVLHSNPPQQQRLRAGLLILVALLLVLLLVQRNGIWKSVLRTLAAAVVALGTAVFLGPMVASTR